MKARILAAALILALLFPAGLLAQTPDKDLASGVRAVEEGDFDSGISILNGVVQQLSAEKSRSKELARAYLYLAIGYLGMSQAASAKARFLDAIANDPQLKLSPKEFPPRVIQSFEEARKEAATVIPRVTRQGPYFDAVKRGDFVAVRDLLKEEPGLVSEKDLAFGATGLHWASLKGHEALVGLLLAQGADPNATNNAGETPYQVAVRAGHTSIAELLRSPEDALFEAAKANDVARVRGMIEANPALLNKKDARFGATALHWAALRGNRETVEYLLSAGADRSARNKDGETPLQVAQRTGHSEVVPMLAGPGGAVAAAPSEAPIFEAVKQGDLERVRRIVQEDRTALTLKDATYGATPLHWAALRGQRDIVAFLIYAGADTKATNRNGETPLQVAQRAGKNDVVQILLQAPRD